MPLIAPYWMFSRNSQTIAVHTAGTIEGIYITARKNDRPTIFEFNRLAIRNAKAKRQRHANTT